MSQHNFHLSRCRPSFRTADFFFLLFFLTYYLLLGFVISSLTQIRVSIYWWQYKFWSAIYVNNIIAISCYELEGPSIPGQTMPYRLNRSVLFGSLRGEVLRTLMGEIAAAKFGEKLKKLVARAKIPIRAGRNFSREGVGKPKRFHQVPRVC